MIECTEEYEKMFDIEEKLWWYRILHERVLASLIQNNIPKNALILDAACGTGGLLLFLKKSGYTNSQGFDLSEMAVKFSKSRGLSIENGDLKNYWDKESLPEFDVIICNDALIYLGPDFDNTLKKIYNKLKTNGLFISNNNALGVFKGIHDLAVGDGVRFTKSELKQAFTKADFKISNQVYFPFLLSPLIMCIRTFQRIKLKLNLVDKENLESDVKLPSPILNNILYKITKAEQTIESIAFIGSSVFTVLKK